MLSAVPGILGAAPVASLGLAHGQKLGKVKVLSQFSPLPRATMTRSPTFPFHSQEIKGR